MGKIKSKAQIQDDLKLESVSKVYDIETLDRICSANRYLERHKEDLLEYVLNNIYLNVNISPCNENSVICNNIDITFINNDLRYIADDFVGLGYSDNVDCCIDPHTRFICEAVYTYIDSVNDMLIKTLQIKNIEFDYVSRKVLITPMTAERCSYYETLLKNIITQTYSATDVEEIVHAIFA